MTTGKYFIRPCGNFDPRMFDTLQAAIDAATESVKATGYTADVFDSIEKRGIVSQLPGQETRFISAHAYAYG